MNMQKPSCYSSFRVELRRTWTVWLDSFKGHLDVGETTKGGKTIFRGISFASLLAMVEDMETAFANYSPFVLF